MHFPSATGQGTKRWLADEEVRIAVGVEVSGRAEILAHPAQAIAAAKADSFEPVANIELVGELRPPVEKVRCSLLPEGVPCCDWPR